MANYENLKALIAAAIKENGNEEITGQLLQGVLLNLVRVLGDGYQFGGVATPNGSPDISADARAFFLAFQAGTYVNYGGVVMASDGIGIITQGDEWAIISIALSSDVFVANAFGDTTFAQVLAAKNAGKAVIAVTPTGDVYTLIGTTLTDGSFGFYTVQVSTARYIWLKPNDTWNGPGEIQLQRVANMVQAIGAGAPDKYPSTAAVKTAINAAINNLPGHLGWFTPKYSEDDGAAYLPAPGTYTQAELTADYGLTPAVIRDLAAGKYAGVHLIDDYRESDYYEAFLGGYLWTDGTIEVEVRNVAGNNIWELNYDPVEGNFTVTFR